MLYSKLSRNIFIISNSSYLITFVQDIIQSMPHDAHPMGVLVSAMSALSIFHPDANPALRVCLSLHYFSNNMSGLVTH